MGLDRKVIVTTSRNKQTMTIFIFQAVLLGAVMILFARRSNRYDLYLSLFAVVWTFAVIVIRIIYGVDHAAFYSSDQGTQIVLLNQFIDEGVSLSLDRIIGGRYIIVAPVWLLNTIGFDALLAFKFFQALSFSSLTGSVLTSSAVKKYDSSYGTWFYFLVHFLFFYRRLVFETCK